MSEFFLHASFTQYRRITGVIIRGIQIVLIDVSRHWGSYGHGIVRWKIILDVHLVDFWISWKLVNWSHIFLHIGHRNTFKVIIMNKVAFFSSMASLRRMKPHTRNSLFLGIPYFIKLCLWLSLSDLFIFDEGFFGKKRNGLSLLILQSKFVEFL